MVDEWEKVNMQRERLQARYASLASLVCTSVLVGAFIADLAEHENAVRNE